MSLTDFLQNKIIDLLQEHRIVVWYDEAGDFGEYIERFDVPKCKVLSTANSILQARREADRIYGQMFNSDDPIKTQCNLLIYNPRPRGVDGRAKRSDLFEVFALIGTAFGDKEDQKLESLARQAMPEMASEITRLFAEGRPDVKLLDSLEDGRRYPLLNEVLGTETPTEIIALSLCDDIKAAAVDKTPGCNVELLRFYKSSTGFQPPEQRGSWEAVRNAAGGYILYSEFVFGLAGGLPEELETVVSAEPETAEIIKGACNRMRADLRLQERYFDLAERVEKNLRLDDIMKEGYLPSGGGTFPFEERYLLRRAAEYAAGGDFNNAHDLIETSRNYIWRQDPQRAADWIALERAVTLLITMGNVEKEMSKHKTPAAMVKVYTADWYAMDRAQRLFENALTASAAEEVLVNVVNLCRNSYREISVGIQDTLLAAIKLEGWPPEGLTRQTGIFDRYVAPAMERCEKTALFLVDSLRFEMGKDLGDALEDYGEVKIDYAGGVVPTVTDVGMASLLPGADGLLRLINDEGELMPALGTRLLKNSTDRMKLLSDTYGDRFMDVTLDSLLDTFSRQKERLADVDLLVIRTQDPDLIAESMGGWRARKYLSDVVGDIASVIKLLASIGFTYIVAAADHGHMLFPEISPGDIVQVPMGEWLKIKRRCLLGSSLAAGPGTVTLKAERVGIKGDVEDICFPTGFKVFSDGIGYFHGGLSLPEAVVPVVVLRATAEDEVGLGIPEIEIRYRSDRFTGHVIGLKVFMERNIFDKSEQVLVEAYDGRGARAKLVGEAADCEARDEKTRIVTLQAGEETSVPVLIGPDFRGSAVEIRVIDPQTRAIWARRKLKNAMLD